MIVEYLVKHHLRRDGKEYGPGDSISLSADQAAQCGTALERKHLDKAGNSPAEMVKNGKREKSDLPAGGDVNEVGDGNTRRAAGTHGL